MWTANGWKMTKAWTAYLHTDKTESTATAVLYLLVYINVLFQDSADALIVILKEKKDWRIFAL